MRTERWGLMALLAVTVVWGTTFPAMKLLSAHLDALQIIWLRFVIALVVLAPLWRGMLRHERRWRRVRSARRSPAPRAWRSTGRSTAWWSRTSGATSCISG